LEGLGTEHFHGGRRFGLNFLFDLGKDSIYEYLGSFEEWAVLLAFALATFWG
jgi:hypothetical protein